MTEDNKLKDLVLRAAKEKDLSLIKLAKTMGISRSYLSDILNRNRTLTHQVVDALAKELDLSKVVLYQAAGYLDLSGEELRIAELQEIGKSFPQLLRLVDELIEMPEQERKRTVLLILAGMGIDFTGSTEVNDD